MEASIANTTTMDFLTYFEARRVGIILILTSLIVLALIIQWLCWIFGCGRFGLSTSGGSTTTATEAVNSDGRPKGVIGTIVFLAGDFITRLINDFRHLLALIIVLIFGLALAYAMYKADGSLPGIRDALQAVSATLGGLVGSVIGYYYGESAAGKAVFAKALSEQTSSSGSGGPKGQGPAASREGSTEPARDEGTSSGRTAPPPPTQPL